MAEKLLLAMIITCLLSLGLRTAETVTPSSASSFMSFRLTSDVPLFQP